ncbi:hypothetical protein [Spirosoma sp. KNUC1025]|uniref:hypothetical protein n=1 Tax=Spirosoma sp. KNUC1025 TaxID=2894082 RepID=UPI003865C3E2|nr:hypothetical protein LN737_09140 [Spirosoma sp. KNUC1025]
MKKQFNIKAAQTSKNILFAAAKNESDSLLKLIAGEDTVCCPWLSRIQGLSPKPTLAL